MSIRVLIVEDSPIALIILKRILTSSSDIKIVGTASTGQEGLALIPASQPDVICTDFFMPKMDGLEFTAQVMNKYPRPILVISASVQEDDTHRIFQLLEAGAVDILPKPKAGLDPENMLLKQALINKIRVLSGVKVFKKKRSFINQRNNRPASLSKPHCDNRIMVVGASTGGPLALQNLFTNLPENFPIPIVCVQHISRGFLQGLLDWLNNTSKLSIRIALAGERPKPGNIYFPSERQHLTLNRFGRFVYSQALPDENHCPSITTLFSSIARVYGGKAVGILLTGMGRDGADGMKAIADAGGVTIAQDESTSVVFGMPKEAIALGAAHQVLPIDAIAPAILQLVG
ncbi:MAG: chemotaxis-specific protein-glutamate methyltransferase CheB [Leptolyngbya sp. SIO3F4]|nr:chemotaxis-specific protein-glutamate methyltransferase CheB [Leptolyngbya sp. SIO3F4]